MRKSGSKEEAGRETGGGLEERAELFVDGLPEADEQRPIRLHLLFQVEEEGFGVCLIEVMKMMNSVPAGFSGTIAGIHAENAALVEYGQPLFSVAPA